MLGKLMTPACLLAHGDWFRIGTPHGFTSRREKRSFISCFYQVPYRSVIERATGTPLQKLKKRKRKKTIPEQNPTAAAMPRPNPVLLVSYTPTCKRRQRA